jgi:hypothetical protein
MMLPADKHHVWELVTAGFPAMWRMRIPGGWLYQARARDDAWFETLFVPDSLVAYPSGVGVS